MTPKQRKELFSRFNGRCAYCGCELPQRWHVDHLEPVERKLKYVKGKGMVCSREMWNPEADKIENMMPSCPACNIDKHSYPLEFWREQIQESCNILARNSSTYRRALRYGLVEEIDIKIIFYFERTETT